MKKTSLIMITLLFSAFCLFGCGFNCNTTDTTQYILSDTPLYFEELDIFVDAGKTESIDINKAFAECGIKVTRYELKSLDTEIATVNKNTVTGAGTGITKIEATLYEKSTALKYEVTLASVYVIDESEFTPVTTAQELSDIGKRENLNGNYILKADIDLAGIEWKPIGFFAAGAAGGSFNGKFVNRSGYKIKNLTITKDIISTPYGDGGLFGWAGSKSYIDGIILENVSITNAEGKGYSTAGGIAGESSGIIANCKVEGEVSSEIQTGGICGISGGENGRIINCEFNGAIKTEPHKDYTPYRAYAGGIAGVSSNIIKNCNATAKISSTLIAGGIVGELYLRTYYSDMTGNEFYYEGKIINCYFKGSVTAPVYGQIVGAKVDYI